MILIIVILPLSFFAASGLKVAIVIESQRGDKAWADATYQGFLKLEDEFELKETAWIECKNDVSLAQSKLIYAAENFDLVILVTGRFFSEIMPKVIPSFPEVNFVSVDSELPLDYENLYFLSFMQNEASFLAGACAAMMTTSEHIRGINSDKTIGFVGGFDVPIIHDFLIGYEDGAKYIYPDINIETIFVGTHYDPSKGKEAAEALKCSGADVIFHAAGLTGQGVLEASSEKGFFSIGVDSSQEYLYPGHIITSAIKKWDRAITWIVESFIEGELSSRFKYMDLDNDGVGLSFSEYALKLMPTNVFFELQKIKELIIKGEIEPKSLYNQGERRY